MKVIFDTNVLISGFLVETGPSKAVLIRCLKRHTVILSEYILEEFREKLRNKIEVPKPVVETAIRYLRNRSRILAPHASRMEFSDAKDIPVLQLIKAASAHYLLTGDKKLLALKKWQSTLILSPREAMEHL